MSKAILPSYRRKSGHKGKACRRNQPVVYSECKKAVNLSLTPTAVERLILLADKHRCSRSEVIERWLRGALNGSGSGLEATEVEGGDDRHPE